jgi:hypothetical protein
MNVRRDAPTSNDDLTSAFRDLASRVNQLEQISRRLPSRQIRFETIPTADGSVGLVVVDVNNNRRWRVQLTEETES